MKQFKNILFVIDPEKTPSNALERAVTLAENNQARLAVLTVIDLIPDVAGVMESSADFVDLQRAIINAGEQALQEMLAPYRERVSIQYKQRIGTPFLEIIREVLREGCDLVMKVADNQDWVDRFLGGDDMHLLRKCPCPVWMIRQDAASKHQRILAAVDVGDSYPPPELETRHALNRRALEMAIAVTLSDFAELHVVHVWNALGESAMRGAFMNKPEEEINAYVEQVRQHHAERLDALMREVTGQLGTDAMNFLKPQVHLVKGYPRREIPALAQQIAVDLIVMGTVARTGVPGFIIGNTAETILNQISCSVLAIKPPGFTTPVTLET